MLCQFFTCFHHYHDGAPRVDELLVLSDAVPRVVLVLDDKVGLLERLAPHLEVLEELLSYGLVVILSLDEDVGEAGDEGGLGPDVLDEDATFEEATATWKMTMVMGNAATMSSRHAINVVLFV